MITHEKLFRILVRDYPVLYSETESDGIINFDFPEGLRKLLHPDDKNEINMIKILEYFRYNPHMAAYCAL